MATLTLESTGFPTDRSVGDSIPMELVPGLKGGRAARIISHMATSSQAQGIRTANYFASLSLRELGRIARMDSSLSSQRLAQAVKEDIYKVNSVFL